MNLGMLLTSPICSNMVNTASFAPPCNGPHNEAMPAEIQAYGFANELDAILTVDVDAFCSWSACKIRILSNASTNISGILNDFKLLSANNIYKKFSTKDYSNFGWIKSKPLALRNAYAAIVGNFATNSMLVTSRSDLDYMFKFSLKNELIAATTPVKIDMGCDPL